MTYRKIFSAILTVCAFSCASYALTEEEVLAKSAQEAESSATVDTNLKIYLWTFSNSVSMPNTMSGAIAYKKKDTGDARLFFVSEGKMVSALPETDQPASLKYKGPAALRLYRQTVSGEDVSYREIGNVTLPQASHIFVLMLKSSGSLRFYPMNIAPDKLPKGKIAIMNIAGENIAISLDGQTGLLKRGAHLIFKPKTKGGAKAEIKLAHLNEAGKWEPIYKNRLRAPEDSRSIFLIYNTTGAKKGARPKLEIQIMNF